MIDLRNYDDDGDEDNYDNVTDFHLFLSVLLNQLLDPQVEDKN